VWPETGVVLKDIFAARDALYVVEHIGGGFALARMSYDELGAPQQVPLPYQGAILSVDANALKAILLRVDFDAGHGLGSSRTQREQQFADEWTFPRIPTPQTIASLAAPHLARGRSVIPSCGFLVGETLNSTNSADGLGQLPREITLGSCYGNRQLP
jgi:hypothetical protein